MCSSEQILTFCRCELEAERVSGWSRLKRIPDTHVRRNLIFFNVLNPIEQESFLDCAAGTACMWIGYIFSLPKYDKHHQHPFFQRWRQGAIGYYGLESYGVPDLRMA